MRSWYHRSIHTLEKPQKHALSMDFSRLVMILTDLYIPFLKDFFSFDFGIEDRVAKARQGQGRKW